MRQTSPPRPNVATGTRTEYRLTEMGLDMFGVAVVQGQWEKVWAQSPLQERYAIAFFDRETGRRLKPAVLTRAHGVEVKPDKVDWKPGPGLIIIPPPTSRRRRSAPIETDRPIIDRSTEIMGDYWSWAVLSAAFPLAADTGTLTYLLQSGSDRIGALDFQRSRGLVGG